MLNSEIDIGKLQMEMDDELFGKRGPGEGASQQWFEGFEGSVDTMDKRKVEGIVNCLLHSDRMFFNKICNGIEEIKRIRCEGWQFDLDDFPKCLKQTVLSQMHHFRSINQACLIEKGPVGRPVSTTPFELAKFLSQNEDIRDLFYDEVNKCLNEKVRTIAWE